MATFSYEAINNTGEMHTGQLEADDEITAVNRLRKMGLRVVDVKEKRSSPFQGLFEPKIKVKIGDLSIFSRQLGAMIDAGIPLTRALFTLSRQATNPGLGKVLEDVAIKVEGGMSFTDALGGYPNVFNSLYLGMINSGEIGGALQETLVRLSDQLQKDKNLSDNIRSATFYPLMILGFAFILLIGMLFFLVPIFMGFFPPGVDLPLPTLIIVTLSDSIREYWYIWIVLLLAAGFLIPVFLRSKTGKRLWDRYKLRIPGFGKLLHRSIIARFARTLATLLAGGVPAVQALHSASAAAGNYLVEIAVENAAEKIQDGQSIAPPLEESDMFPPMVTHMIAIGEETGALPELLDRVAEFLEEEVAILTKGISAMLEPILLVGVGIAVGGMLLALYLPMFTVITEVM